jgi:hypothetical protein
VRIGTDGGTSLKSSDRYCVPLCGPHTNLRGGRLELVEGCHAEQHRGERTFWTERRIDPLIVASKLWKVSGDVEAGERIILLLAAL